MKKMYLIIASIAIICLLIAGFLGCSGEAKEKKLTEAELVSLGKYLVHTSACDDCHTPKIFTDQGPMFDTTKMLSGFPQDEVLPAIDMKYIGGDKWIATDKHLGAWVGPWGISFSANLTPDNATGIGAVSEEMFIKTIREGRLKGIGRPLLPPMPWHVYAGKTDQDLKAMYAYLKSIKPIKNQVPLPVSPDKVNEKLARK